MKYIIRCQGPPPCDYVRTPNGMWTNFTTYQNNPHTAQYFPTRGKAEAMLDEIKGRMGKRAEDWTLTVEEHKP